jgi:hypothetical protein
MCWRDPYVHDVNIIMDHFSEAIYVCFILKLKQMSEANVPGQARITSLIEKKIT